MCHQNFNTMFGKPTNKMILQQRTNKKIMVKKRAVKRIAMLISIVPCLIQAQDDEHLITTIKKHKEVILSLSFSEKGDYLASSAKDKKIMITSTQNWELVKEYENYFPVNQLEFISSDDMLLTSGPDIKHVDFNNQKLNLYAGNPTHLWSFDYSTTLRKIVAGSYDKKVRIWNIDSRKILHTLEGHEKNALAVAISSRFPYMVTGSLDRSIRIWDANSGKLKFIIERHTKNIYDLEFHPDGIHFLSASADQSIRLCNAETGNVIKTYAGHEREVLQVKFTPDGEHFYSASVDGTVRLWQTRTGKMIYSFVNHVGTVNCLAVHPENKYLATGGEDNNIHVYEVSKKLFVINQYYDEYEKMKADNAIFAPRKKGESKDAYAARQFEAKSYDNKWMDIYYDKYMKELKQTELTDKSQ